MRIQQRWAGIAVAVAAFASMLPVLARADVRDTTGLFSAQAAKQADATIDQIHRQTGKDVVVEVFPNIPADLRNDYKAD